MLLSNNSSARQQQGYGRRSTVSSVLVKASLYTTVLVAILSLSSSVVVATGTRSLHANGAALPPVKPASEHIVVDRRASNVHPRRRHHRHTKCSTATPAPPAATSTVAPAPPAPPATTTVPSAGKPAVPTTSAAPTTTTTATVAPAPAPTTAPAPVTPPPTNNNSTIVPPKVVAVAGNSLLNPWSTDAPNALYARRTHVVTPVNLESPGAVPLATNKFYGNLLVGAGHAPIWTQPFGLRWDASTTNAAQQGLAISHIDNDMKAFGPTDANGNIKFYINPFLVSLGFGATELDQGHQMKVRNMDDFGCQMVMAPGQGAIAGQSLSVPVVRGMAFISGVYKNLTPRFFSQILVRTLTLDPNSNKLAGGNWVKYRFVIENGVTWLVYAKTDAATDKPLALTMNAQDNIVATSGPFTGLIQVAKIPVGDTGAAEAAYDAAVGTYVTKGNLVVNRRASDAATAPVAYGYEWVLGGNTAGKLLHFTLPHHRQVIDNTTVAMTGIQLPSTTKGLMVAVTGNTWTMQEPQRVTVGLLNPKPVSAADLATIKTQVTADVNNIDFNAATNLDSMYFAGKGLAKLGLLCMVAKDVVQDAATAATCLTKLESAFDRFLTNNQQFPLVYDTTWKGLISRQGLDVGALADFGNSWYNDHHYHYGYFVHTAALIRHMDPNWKTADVDAFVTTMLRDVVNPSTTDTAFPRFRSFDWFMGHSWSQGIFESQDGKDEESTSEEINLHYAMNLWGQVSGKKDVQDLAEVVMTVAKRSIQSYFLLKDNNMNHPKEFIGNHVTGILFENKVDHTTYFSPRLECIQGIQMIPATPALPIVRDSVFVKQEWDSLLTGIVNGITDGWKSILMTNFATIDPQAGWTFFVNSLQPGATPIPLDDGLTLSWILYYIASQK